MDRKKSMGYLGFLSLLGFRYFETGNSVDLIPFGFVCFFLFFIKNKKTK